MNLPVNPYEKYKQQSIMTMTQGEMLVKLYEETAKQLNAATFFIGEGEISKTNDALKKAQRILNHLKATLNPKVEMSGSLEALYDYFLRQIVSANVKKDASYLEDVIPMVVELGETFGQAERLSRIQ